MPNEFEETNFGHYFYIILNDEHNNSIKNIIYNNLYELLIYLAVP